MKKFLANAAFLSLLVCVAWASAQEGERRETERRERQLREEQRQTVEPAAALRELNAHLENLRAQQKELAETKKEDRKELVARQIRETAAKVEVLKAALRGRDRGREREREGQFREEKRVDVERAHTAAAVRELSAHLEKLRAQQKELAETKNEDKKELVGRQIRETTAKLEDLKSVLREGERGRDREGERGREREGEGRRRGREGRSEIEAGRNQLEHMRAAIGHLREAGLTELATAIAQRAEKLQAAIHRAGGGGKGEEARRREGREREREHAEGREREGHERKRPEGRREADANVRELSNAIRQLREQVAKLQEQVGELRKRRER